MKTTTKLLLLSLLLMITMGATYSTTHTSLVPPVKRKIQIAILFDTSGSMPGLIEQAKSTIWQVVNSASKLTVNGEIPELEISLYDYGNSGIKTANWIRKQTDLITDLDSISGQLFSLTIDGGEEYCAAVIQSALKDLKWSSNPEDLKIIYIAGNEMFNQGPIDYKKILKDAAVENIIVNTVYCGPYEQGVRELWFDAAQQGQGSYFNIDANQEVVHYATPYDNELNVYSDSLNATYVGYGDEGQYREQKQKKEDANAFSKGAAVSADRAVAKSNANYKNSSWDLVDGYKDGSVNLEELKQEKLPDHLKNKTPEQIEAYIKTKNAERLLYQSKIREISIKRNQFIEEEKKKHAAEKGLNDLGAAIQKSLFEYAQKNGYSFKE
ncbi:MAG TPA: vWA domain-containing protein [Fluviicola sp.]|nr:vWA domain-containing protein [Fluviicola sp.]